MNHSNMLDLRKELVRNSHHEKVYPFTLEKFLCIIPKIQPALLLSFFIILLGCYDDSNNQSTNPNDYIDTGIAWSKKGEDHTVLLLGDSRFYRSLNNCEWNEFHWTIYNCAYSGTSIVGIITRLHYVDELHPDIVILSTGANDYIYNDHDSTAYKERLAFVMAYLLERKVHIIIMDAPLATAWYVQFPILMEMLHHIENTYSEYFCNVILTDEDRVVDGLHENEQGYEKVVQAIKEFVKNMERNKL